MGDSLTMPLGHLIYGVFSIVLIDLMLAGDNALVIAMAVRSLPPKQRRMGTILGAGAAVVLRVGLTFVAAQLLNVQFLKLAGGVLVLWIAVKVLVDASDPEEVEPAPGRIMQVIWYIVVADITMSTDNILAIAGASRGHFELIVFGLALSIPFVVLSANLLARLMDRYPFLIFLGSGILGEVGGEMILTDGFVVGKLHPAAVVRYTVEGLLVVALILTGYVLSRRRHKVGEP